MASRPPPIGAGSTLYFWTGLRGDTIVETEAILTVVTARVKRVHIYSNIEETR